MIIIYYNKNNISNRNILQTSWPRIFQLKITEIVKYRTYDPKLIHTVIIESDKTKNNTYLKL